MCGHLVCFAEWIFMMLTDRAAVLGLLEPREETTIHHAFAERAPRVLPNVAFLLPIRILHEDRRQERLDQSRFRRPGETAFDGGVANVETDTDVLWVQVANHRKRIPYRRAHVA